MQLFLKHREMMTRLLTQKKKAVKITSLGLLLKTKEALAIKLKREGKLQHI